MKIITLLSVVFLSIQPVMAEPNEDFNQKAQISAYQIIDNWFPETYQATCSLVGDLKSVCEVVDGVTGLVQFSMTCTDFNGKALCGINTAVPCDGNNNRVDCYSGSNQ